MFMSKYSNDIQGITTIEELRTFHNERIIHLTYIVMLGRYADDGALKHLINELALNNGFTIKEMQNDLRNSDEYQI